MLAILFWMSVIFIIYTYFGYPIIISILASIIPKRLAYLDSFPSVTLLIPAYNEELVIAKKIENCLALDYPKKLQILIVASGSDDQTPEIIKSFQDRDVELCYTPERRGKMSAIIQGMQKAQGEVVVFSDANNIYDNQTLLKLLKPFSDLKVGASTGSKLIIQDGRELSTAEGFYWKYESWIKTNETKLSSCTSAVGEILAIRRNLFVPPPDNIINDDHCIVMDVIKRGFNVVYTPEAHSYEYVSSSSQGEIIRRSRMNAGLYQMIFMSWRFLPIKRPIILWQILSHKYFRAFIPFALICTVITNLILVLLPVYEDSSVPFLLSSFFWKLVLSLQILLYGTAILGNHIKPGGILNKIIYIPAFVVNSNWAALKGLNSFISGKQTHIWKRVSRGE
jgi:poly-beta-1,6-N-acetyl-D-glucosamine synthase